MSELDFDWGERPTAMVAAKSIPVKKIDVTVAELDEHNCTAKHRTRNTFIKCALRRYSYNQVEKASLPEVLVKGEGEWMTVHESLSEIYYSYSYDTDQEYEHQYKILECYLFKTLEEAAEWQKYQKRFCQSSTGCSFSCNSIGMWGYVSKIVMD